MGCDLHSIITHYLLSADMFDVAPTDESATQEMLDRATGLLSEGTKLATEANESESSGLLLLGIGDFNISK